MGSSSPIMRALCRRAFGAQRAALGLLLAAALGVGCGGDDGETGSTTTTTTTEAPCGPGELELADGRCQPPGLPLDMPCPPGEAPLEDGSCQAAGVPPSECGDGFTADGEGGCEPILPKDPCPDGLMAIPGETVCHEVAPCGAGPWGDIPVEANTQFVDGAYSGMDSDGSQEKPWKTIQAAVDAAASGAIVAIAAGTYKENVALTAEPKRLWGRCPSMVTIEGLAGPGTVTVSVTSDGSEIRDLAVTGTGSGVGVAAEDVVIERVWIHDTGLAGVIGQGAGVTVRGSLLERTHVAAVAAQSGATVIVEGSAVRDTLPDQNGNYGRAVDCIPGGAVRNDVTVRSSVIERASDVGLVAGRSDLLVEGVAVRDMAPVEGLLASPGVGVAAHRSDITIVGSTIERASAGGLEIVGSNATIERVTVKDTLGLPVKGPLYRGISAIEEEATGTPSVLTLRRSAISGSPHSGVSVFRSSATIESALVRDNVRDLETASGAALRLHDAEATILYTVITGNQLAGLGQTGGTALFEASVVEDMKLDLGAGACLFTIELPNEPPGTLTVRSSLLRDCSGVGALAHQAHLVVDTSVIRDVYPDSLGYGGDGASVINETNGDGTLVVTGTHIDAPARAGVSSFGGLVDHGSSAITCAKHGLVGEASGSLPFTFDEPGASFCGCPDAIEPCLVESPGLTPPVTQ